MLAFTAKGFCFACLVVALFCGATVRPAEAQDKLKHNDKDDAEMVYIPAGEFWMGDDDMKDNPRHKVTLSGYYIYKNLVTVGQYQKFCEETNRRMPAAPKFDPGWSQEDHPMVNVSWNDAKAYCDWAGVSLPTEAQWEKAAQGPQGYKFPWGNKFDGSKLQGEGGGTAAVGSSPANGYGLYDMAGSVWQWCSDWYDKNFCNSRRADLPDPVNMTPASYRAIRGGCWWYVNESDYRCSHRDGYLPDCKGDYFGFRCVARVDSH